MTLHISGLQTIGGTAHLEKAIEAVPRVSSVRLDPDAERVLVQHDGAAPDEVLRAARSSGFTEVRAET